MLLEAIPAGDEAVIALANALNQYRPLTDTETRMVQSVVWRQRRAVKQFKHWTDEEDAKLRKMRAAGLSSAQMAKALNRSEQAVYTRVYYLKKKRRAQ